MSRWTAPTPPSMKSTPAASTFAPPPMSWTNRLPTPQRLATRRICSPSCHGRPADQAAQIAAKRSPYAETTCWRRGGPPRRFGQLESDVRSLASRSSTCQTRHRRRCSHELCRFRLAAVRATRGRPARCEVAVPNPDGRQRAAAEFYAGLPDAIGRRRRPGASMAEVRVAEKMIAVVHPRDASDVGDGADATVGFATPRLSPRAQFYLLRPAI